MTASSVHAHDSFVRRHVGTDPDTQRHMLEVLGCDLLGVIPDDETVIRAGNLGEPVARGNTQVSLAYRNIASRLMGEEVPFQELTSAGFFRKLLLKFG